MKVTMGGRPSRRRLLVARTRAVSGWAAFGLAVAFATAFGQMPEAQPSPPAFRVTHHDLKAEIEPKDHSLQASANVTLESLVGSLRTIRLYLLDSLMVRSVAEGERPLTFSRPDDTADRPMFATSASPLDIDLGRSLARHDRATIRIDYDGVISDVEGINMITPELIELAGYAAWFPLERQNGLFTYRLTLTLPPGLLAVADGQTIGTPGPGAGATWIFRRDLPAFDISLVAGPALKLRERRDGGLVSRVVFQNLEENLAISSIDGAVDCASLMSGLFGPSAAGGGLTIVFSPRGGWGYSRAPYIIGPERFLSQMLANPAGRRENYRGLAHEAAHFWWNIAATQTSDDWINESLAEYYSLRALEAFADSNLIADAWRDQHWAANMVPKELTIRGTLRNQPAAYGLFYHKGSSIFRTLESWMGREALDRVLARFYQAHRTKRDATTESLLTTFRREAGSGYEAYLDRMHRLGGLPSLRVQWAPGDREASGKVFLDDAAAAGFPLVIRFNGGTGAGVNRTVALLAGETSWKFALPFEPRSVTVDPEARFLQSVPSAALSARLRPLLHGMNMDPFPEIIPNESIDRAKAVLAEWAGASAEDPVLEFEKGSLALVEGRAVDAIAAFSAVISRIGELPNKKFHEIYAYTKLGNAHDLAGDRSAALDCYKKAEASAASLGLSPINVAAALQSYRDVPYPRGKLLHVAVLTGNLKLMDTVLAGQPKAINARDPYRGMSPIFWAVDGMLKRPVIEWLVGHGADINARDEKGQTLLSFVRERGDKETEAFLTARGARDSEKR